MKGKSEEEIGDVLHADKYFGSKSNEWIESISKDVCDLKGWVFNEMHRGKDCCIETHYIQVVFECGGGVFLPAKCFVKSAFSFILLLFAQGY